VFSIPSPHDVAQTLGRVGAAIVSRDPSAAAGALLAAFILPTTDGLDGAGVTIGGTCVVTPTTGPARSVRVTVSGVVEIGPDGVPSLRNPSVSFSPWTE
jgi:hypothetical protein